MAVISLEVSTSSAKGILFSVNDGTMMEVSQRFGSDIADGVTQEPNGILQSVLAVLKEAAQAAASLGVSIEAIGLTGIWHSLLLLGKKREPIGRIRTWADLSGADYISTLRQDEKFVDTVYHETGSMVHAMYPAWKWYYMRHNVSSLCESARYVSSQIEFVFESLTGQAAVSLCTASGTGFFNIHTLDWDENILDMIGLERSQLSELVEAFYTAPLRSEIARAVGLPSGVPVTVGCADGAMNQLAIGGLSTGVMSMSVGTSGAIRIVHLEPKIPAKLSTWCYYLLRERRLAGAAVNNATNCVDWFLAQRHGQLTGDVYNRYSRGIETVERANAPIFLPFLFGERCPGWNENRVGGFIGVKGTHSSYDLYYSILEGVLFSLRQCYDILVEVGGCPDEVLVSGGIANSPAWLQMVADVFQREIKVTAVSNQSTIGGALVALEAVGGEERVQFYRPEVIQSLEPKAEMAELYQSRYERYLDLYSLLG